MSRPFQIEGLLQDIPIELAGKKILIDIKVIDATLDYNILLGHSYMYTMKAVTSSVFHTLISSHNGKIVTMDQLTHYKSRSSLDLDNILPLIGSHSEVSPVVEISLGIFQDPSLLGIYHGEPNDQSSLETPISQDIPERPTLEFSPESPTMTATPP
jgi:hypothetical protein